jgi:hypothetical protein
VLVGVSSFFFLTAWIDLEGYIPMRIVTATIGKGQAVDEMLMAAVPSPLASKARRHMARPNKI